MSLPGPVLEVHALLLFWVYINVIVRKAPFNLRVPLHSPAYWACSYRQSWCISWISCSLFKFEVQLKIRAPEVHGYVPVVAPIWAAHRECGRDNREGRDWTGVTLKRVQAGLNHLKWQSKGYSDPWKTPVLSFGFIPFFGCLRRILIRKPQIIQIKDKGSWKVQKHQKNWCKTAPSEIDTRHTPSSRTRLTYLHPACISWYHYIQTEKGLELLKLMISWD